ncbi:MAG: methyltransferase [Deltaproteobacteria bacterium]|nr:methyltransferase [Deltaproteobacteria bacterium]MBI3389088.1 methyltransferase [Deltaproteobacteria bacterium]
MSVATGISRATEDSLTDLPGGPLWLTRLANLADHVDRDALLRDERASEPPYWAHLWPAALALARLVANAGARLDGRRVLEVGCGLGVPALVAARCGAAVVLTDRNVAAARFANRNLRRNGLHGSVAVMDWRQPAICGPFDLCLAADVTYDPTANERLMDFLIGALASDGEAWIAESVRAEEATLPQLMKRHFAVHEQRLIEIEDGHRVWVRVLQGRR